MNPKRNRLISVVLVVILFLCGVVIFLDQNGAFGDGSGSQGNEPVVVPQYDLR